MNRKANKTIEIAAMRVAEWVGTPQSIIIHTMLFVMIFVLHVFGVGLDDILLLLTTIVSLEAIYLSLFIQMTVNQHSERLADVGEDIDDLHEDVEDITENIDDVQEDVEHLQTNVKGIAEDVEDIGEDVDDIAEDAENEPEPDYKPKPHELTMMETLARIQKDMGELTEDVRHMKQALHEKPR